MKSEDKVFFGLPKEARLRRPEEFKAVKDSGVRARAGGIMVGFLPGPEKRLGIAAPKSVGSSPARNRVKRVIREFFRLNRELFPEGDCVVITGTNSGKLSNGEIRARLKQALEKLSEIVRD